MMQWDHYDIFVSPSLPGLPHERLYKAERKMPLPETHRAVAALLRKLEGAEQIQTSRAVRGAILLHVEGAGFDIDAADCEDLPTRVPGVVLAWPT